MKLCVIQTSWLGDNVLTLPLVQNLAAYAETHVVTLPQWQDIYKTPYVTKCHLFHRKGPHATFRGFLSFAKQLQNEYFDGILLPQKWFRNALLAKLSGCRKIVGFADAPARFLYTSNMPYDKKLHEVERMCNLAGEFVPKFEYFSPKLFPTSEFLAYAEDFMSKYGNKKIICIAPGAAWETKRYPYYAELARELVVQNFAVVALGTEAEREYCEKIANYADAQLFLSKSILQSSALMSKCAVVVANDSGAGHIAAASGVPVVTVFGSTAPILGFVPYGVAHCSVEIDLPCRPCTDHGRTNCPLKSFKCMKNLEITDIIKAINKVIDEIN